MSGPLDISWKYELLFIKSLLIPAFDSDNELDTSKKRKEWLKTRGKQKQWNLEVLAELVERYGTVKSLEEAERKLEGVKAERLLEKAEEEESKQAAPPTQSDLVAAVKLGLKEVRNEEKIVELDFSSCSDRTVRAYLAHMHVGFVRGITPDFPTSSTSFDKFQWLCEEEDDTPRAMAHLEVQLKKFGVPLQEGGYELYDVHASKSILSLEDRKTGVLKGGTDLILGPYGLHELGVVQQSCVAFELKTEAAITKDKINSFLSQATLELIAANYYSNQTTLVVLTDLSTATSVLTLGKVPNTEDLNVVVYEKFTLQQAAQFVARHLADTCAPSVNYRLGAEGFAISKEAVEVLQVFKKARVSPLEDSVVWEHFQEMLQDSAPCTRERAEAINELYRACDYPQPVLLSMYT